MYRSIAIVIGIIIALLVAVNVFHSDEPANLKLEMLKQEYAFKPVPSVDHHKLAILQAQFKTPQEVTETCLTCHTETHKEIMSSSHWNWDRLSYVKGKGVYTSGKKNVMNNFCLGSNSNEKACAKCHIGYGMGSDEFDFANARNVDCMVCHDNSEEYLKGASMAGYPDRSVNLHNVAQSVGMPTKTNCGSCHFFSGGGNNVKHGDLEVAQLSCDREVDVHMASNGLNMECVACHTAQNHQIKGKLYSVSTNNIDRSNCADCHTSTPHFSDVLNRHGSKIACQTCHIPEYAKVNSTKMSWKWSEAGKLKDGFPYEEEDSLGNHNYMSIKGAFVWERNVKPDYVWFNGTAEQYRLGDSITEVPVQMNTLHGSYNDKNSKIIPVKIHTGDQIYDTEYNRLIQPLLYGDEKGDGAYWNDFNWDKAIKKGMEITGEPFSGNYDFIETEMYWPLNHMVSPKDKSLSCVDCHTRNNGRLEKLTGFYLPGRDTNSTLDLIGKWLLIITVLGVAGHALIRVGQDFINNRYKKQVIDYSKKELKDRLDS
ncbi:tetrathionate reductase family octaheme c-type cytochrome [Lutibacter sp. TH_r2]|uniref:tetrathionate reductase family octaheme c-type cytochrome n=1 Tax=Lutibacter sp. TH_r2 TaxID=3082083 RepID=UPI002954B724|nr:tetrathionate reductase family octaheme c-type cytochrome [Lutibacter sp. TH_r2]MDV7188189.1 tetrathionate reductase family octaheme c-type cytochrome [Lutibacter sp. TH_r2]